MKQQLERGLLMVLATIFVAAMGCQSIGLAPAQSLDDRIAYSYGTLSGFRTAAAIAVENGRLANTEGHAVLETTNQIRAILDAAKAATTAGDVATAEGRLTLAVSLLTALQTRLNAPPRSPT